MATNLPIALTAWSKHRVLSRHYVCNDPLRSELHNMISQNKLVKPALLGISHNKILCQRFSVNFVVN